MSDYVSGLMADNIRSINVAQKLSEVSSRYNLDILTVIGDESVSSLPDFHQDEPLRLSQQVSCPGQDDATDGFCDLRLFRLHAHIP